MTPQTTDVLVLGAGFAGVCAGAMLRRAGRRDFLILDRGTEPGGTWRDNTYPGCACDVPSTLYSFSFAPNAEWSSIFAPQPEIQAYLGDVIDRMGVREHLRLGVDVESAAWNDDEQRWHITTSGEEYRARVLISGAGPWHEPLIPDLPGLDTFTGTTFHSSRWDHEHDLRGERVAVIGSGASAVQFVPKIAPDVAQLDLFQRTPHWVLPKPDGPYPERMRRLYRRWPVAQRAAHEGLRLAMEGLGWATRHARAMKVVQRIGEKHLERQVPDPALRAALTPDFTLGCKRMLMSNTYFGSLQRDNVAVVPHAVTEVRERSVVGADGVERPADTIIFGTGFHILDMPVADIVRGRDGRTMAETWAGSPRGYLGTTTAGFPNLFILLGPNLGNGHSSATVVLEQQMTYVVRALEAMDRQQLVSVDVREDVQRAFNEEVDTALTGTVWNAGGCGSYYFDENGRNSFMYPWSTLHHRRRTRRFDLGSYRTTNEEGRSPLMALALAHPVRRVDEQFLRNAPLVITASVDLDASPDAVFEALGSDEMWSWVPVLDKLRWITPRPLGEGSVRILRIGKAVEVEEDFFIWEEGRRAAFTVVSASKKAFDALAEDFVVEPTSRGTRLTWTMAVDPGRPLPGPLRKALPKILGPGNKFALSGIKKIIPAKVPA
ncbi:MAG: SRPBCC family protein [Solirubrobacteraceae bacterium]|nr:SRPBCC family protein [Solirubrobacteraceae bacterium]